MPKRRLAAYRRLAKRAARIWRDHGALEYRESVGDDLSIAKVVSFSKLARVKRGETVIFSWIGYRSRAHRDAVNARVMKDPRIAKMMTEASPFDPSRMAYSGFKMIVDEPRRRRKAL